LRVRSITKAAAVSTTAAALVFSGGSIASADDAPSQSSGSAPASSSRVEAGWSAKRMTTKATSITSIAAQSIAIGSRKNRTIAVAAGGSVDGNTKSIVANISRGGKVKTRATISMATGRGSFTYQVGFGRGTYTVGPTRITRTDGSSYVDGTRSTFTVKSNTKTTLRMGKRAGSTTRVAKAYVKAYSPSKNRYVSYNPIAKLKVKSGSSYKTKKTLKLRRGYDRYTFRTSKRHTYRLYTRGSSLVYGTRTGYIKI